MIVKRIGCADKNDRFSSWELSLSMQKVFGRGRALEESEHSTLRYQI